MHHFVNFILEKLHSAKEKFYFVFRVLKDFFCSFCHDGDVAGGNLTRKTTFDIGHFEKLKLGFSRFVSLSFAIEIFYPSFTIFWKGVSE